MQQKKHDLFEQFQQLTEVTDVKNYRNLHTCPWPLLSSVMCKCLGLIWWK